MTTLETMLQVTDDLKFLNRLNKNGFKTLLFPNSIDSYVTPKWNLFQEDKLAFIWSCSPDKVKILVDYINDCKNYTY